MAAAETSTPRRSGRPKKAVLSRQLILETALRLLDKRGENASGMREIARELGVGPSALYNHVDGYDDLIKGVRELVSDRIDVSGFGELPWEQAVERWARSYRNAFAAHPPTIALLAVRPLVPGTRTSRMYDAVSQGLLDAGWPDAEVLSTIVALECFILGAALDHAAPDDMLDPGDDPDAPAFRRVYAAAHPPASAAAAWAAESPADPAATPATATPAAAVRPTDVSFELGLAAFIAGLKARRAQFTA